MVRRNSLVTAIACLILTLSLPALGVPGYRLALPADCKVTIRWVSPPLDPNQLEQAQWSGKYEGGFKYRFDVDASGAPWFAIRPGYQTPGQILNPLKQVRFGLSHTFTGMACLDNGAMLFCTEHDLGFIGAFDAPVIREGLPILPFQPAVALPLPRCRVFAGANSAVYLVGTTDSGVREVFLLQPETLSPGEGRILRRLRKVFTSTAPIEAVTGDGQTTFVAMGRTIARISSDMQSQPDVLIHPEEAIKSLAYHPTAGLFYATDMAIGMAGENGTWDFLPLTWTQIALRGDSLYVCPSDSLGVFVLDHVSDLARYARDGLYTVHSPKRPTVEVGDIIFRASLADPANRAVNGRAFERSGIRAVQGICDLHVADKQTTPMALTVQWSGPCNLREDGYIADRRTWQGIIDFSDGSDKQVSLAAPYEETFYPGEYTMTILINGIELGRGTFTITGKTTVFEAAMQDSIPLLQTLLEQSDAPDERSEGRTPLFISAFYGSTAAVELLLKHGAQVNMKDEQGITPLFYTALGYDQNPAGALAVARLLIQHGAEVATRDKDGLDVLDRYKPDADLVDLLLQHGTTVDARDSEGDTRLARVIRFGYGEPQIAVAECLIRHGADINATNHGGNSILDTALLAGDADIMHVLLEHGANPDRPSVPTGGNKRFPLVYAAVMHPEQGTLLERLLSHGADPDAEEFTGYTALSRVIDTAAPDSVLVLLRHGASLTADCRVQNQIGSPLRAALLSYLAYAPTDRVSAQKARDIFFMLLKRGARLREQEEPIVADKRLHGWLPVDFILDILTRNDRAVIDARDLADPQLQQVVINRLLAMAQAKTAAATSKLEYQAALALCDQAKTRSQIWRIESQCPLIYYNTGLLYGQLGEIEAAKDNFRRYLALAPNARDAETIRKSIGL